MKWFREHQQKIEEFDNFQHIIYKQTVVSGYKLSKTYHNWYLQTIKVDSVYLMLIFGLKVFGNLG